MATTVVSGVQYSGMWTLEQATNAKAAGTWPLPPEPHLFTWGANAYGQLGLNTSGAGTYKSSPAQVGNLTTWVSVSANAKTRGVTTAVKSDGTLWTWGQNSNGELGDGTTINKSSPIQVGALTNWLQVSCGLYTVYGVKTNGTLWAWGLNTNGQLGDGTTAAKSSPTQIGALTTWAKVSGGNSFAMAIKTNGTLWAWGNNNLGRLGLENTTYYSSPKQVGSLTDWLSIVGGRYHTAAIKTDGTLWTWGKNDVGQLGLGTSGSYTVSPQQVGSLTSWLAVAAGWYTTIGIARTV